jgi:hypothetical protein
MFCQVLDKVSRVLISLYLKQHNTYNQKRKEKDKRLQTRLQNLTLKFIHCYFKIYMYYL